MLGLAVLVLIVGIRTPVESPQTPDLWDGLVPGDYAVGFTRLWGFDRSRIWPRSAGSDSVAGPIHRPIRVDVWYPASGTFQEHMPLRSYLEMAAPSREFEDLVFLTHRWDEYSYRGLAEDSTAFDRLMAVETAAGLDVEAAAGRFPLVVYSGGWFNRAPDNTILAEYIACHGYVVAAIPQTNPGLWTYDFHSDAASVENQVRDLEMAVGMLSDSPMVDRRRVASMGYSTGGDVALLLQSRNPLIDAVIALDGSWTLSEDNDVAGSPLFNAEGSGVPILIARRVTKGRASADSVLAGLIHAPRIIAEIPGGDHGTFSDDPSQRRFLGRDTPRHEETHTTMARIVVGFLDAVLGQDPKLFDGTRLSTRFERLGADASFLPAQPGRRDQKAPDS